MPAKPDTNPELIRLPLKDDALEIVYALKLRGITASADQITLLPKRNKFAVTVAADELEKARVALHPILDALLPIRADDGRGGCYFCGYSLLGTSSFMRHCSECGNDLLSVESRFAARNGSGKGI